MQGRSERRGSASACRACQSWCAGSQCLRPRRQPPHAVHDAPIVLGLLSPCIAHPGCLQWQQSAFDVYRSVLRIDASRPAFGHPNAASRAVQFPLRLFPTRLLHFSNPLLLLLTTTRPRHCRAAAAHFSPCSIRQWVHRVVFFPWPVPCIATPALSACVAYRSCTSLWLTSTPLGQLALCYCPPPVGSFPYAAAAYYLPLSAAVRSSPRSLCLGHQEAVRQRYVESSKPPHLPRPPSAVTIAAPSATVFDADHSKH